MARLRECPDCGGMVGRGANKCPKCGHAFTRWYVWPIGAFIVLLLILILREYLMRGL